MQHHHELDSIVPDLVKAVPALRGVHLKQIVTPLGGHSNSNYRLNLSNGSFVLRVPRPNSGAFLIDRQEEVEAARFAGRVGIGPRVVYANALGVMLTRYLDNAKPMSVQAYRSDPCSVRRAAEVVARLHRSGHRFKRRFDPFRIIHDYTTECRMFNPCGPVLSCRLGVAVEEARARVMASSVPPVPSHGDLVPENCLDTGSRMFLIDWEYARMNDPAWDLAYLCVEGAFNEAQEHLLLESYNDHAMTYARLQVFKLLTCALNALWGALRESRQGRLVIGQWTNERLASATQIVEDPKWENWLADLR